MPGVSEQDAGCHDGRGSGQAMLSRSAKVLRDKEREQPFVQALASIHNPAKLLPMCLIKWEQNCSYDC